MRTATAIIIGTVVGALVVAGVQFIGHQLFPPPEGFDITDPEQAENYVANLPLSALISVVVAWAIGALAGGAVAGRIARHQWQPASVTVGAFLLLAGAITMLQFPHPLWMWIAGVVLPLPMAWYGGHLSHNLVGR